MVAIDHIFSPHGNHRDVWHRVRRQRRIVVGGAKGTGKTRNDLELAYAVAESNPNGRGFFARQTRVSMTNSVLPMFEREVVPRGHPCLGGASATNRNQYVFPNGHVIDLLGLNDPGRLESSEYDWGIVFEAQFCDPKAVRTLDSRIRADNMGYRFLIVECNPQGPRHWIAKWFTEGLLNEDGERVPVPYVKTLHSDNPVFWDPGSGDWTTLGREYVLGTLGALEGIERRRNLDGEWCQGDGLVYDVFDADANVTEEAPEPSEVTIAIDDGTTHPFVALRLEWDHDGGLHVADERWGKDMLWADKKDAVRELGGMDADVIVYDAAARDLGLELADEFPHVVPCDKNVMTVEAGCQVVRNRMARNRVTGKPRLTVHPRCGLLLSQIDMYEYAKDPRTGESTGKIKKANDDAPDALRYGVIEHDTRMEAMVA